MKNIILSSIFLIFSGVSLFAQKSDLNSSKEEYRKLFVNSCLQEAKKQKLNIDSRSFCNCSFEKLFSRLEETGVSIEDSAPLIEKISQSPEYEKEVEACLSSVMGKGGENDGISSELKKICFKSMSKNKYMRKNTDVNEICDCTIAKYQDSQYTIMDFSNMTEEEAAGFFERISQECILYYFENKK